MTNINDFKGLITDFNSNVDDVVTDFDNSLYDDLETKIRLTRVNWDSDYSHAVNWTIESRKNFFHETGDDWLDLEPTNFNIKTLKRYDSNTNNYKGYIIVDLPYDVIETYNYMYISRYIEPVYPDNRRENVEQFFFISELEQLAPSSVKVFLQLDVWTTNFNNVSINALTLERGHWPLANISADEYLLNPVSSPVDLTAPEDDLPSVKTLAHKKSLFSAIKSNPVICVASTADFGDPGVFSYPQSNPQGFPDDWYKNNVFGVNGNTPVVAGSTNKNKPTAFGYTTTINEFYGFIDNVKSKAPWILSSILSIFVLPEEFINKGKQVNFMNTNFFRITRNEKLVSLGEFSLEKEKFGFEDDYKNMAKLYTSQFSELIISDDKGNSSTLSVEELAGNIEVWMRISTMFPFLKMEAFLDGIGSKGFENYSISPWETLNVSIPNSISKIYEFDIPVYTIFVDPTEATLPFQSIKNWLRKENLDNDLQKANLQSNNSYNISKNSADLSRDTESRMNTIERTNSLLNNSTTLETSLQQNASDKENDTTSIEANELISQQSAYLDHELSVWDADLVKGLDRINSQLSGWATLTNMEASRQLALLQYYAGNTPVGFLSATLEDASSHIWSAYSGGTSLTGLEFNEEVRKVNDLQQQFSWALQFDIDGNNLPITFGDLTFEGPSFLYRSSALTEGTNKNKRDRTLQVSQININRITDRDTEISNRRFTTNASVSQKLKSTADAVVNNVFNANNANIAARHDNDYATATAVKSTADTVASMTHAIGVTGINVDTATSLAGQPTRISEPSGVAADVFGTKGITIQVRTIPKSSEIMVGEVFNLYGYRVKNIVIKEPKLRQMKEFSYWKCSDIFLDAGKIPDIQEMTIRNCFLNGVTIWEDPNHVKDISVENIPLGD